MPPARATRGRRRRTLGAAAALALAARFASACGKESNADLPQQRASTLRSALDQVEARVNDRDCTGAAQQASAFRQEVASLPSRVDRDLRDALEGSAARLESLVSQQCAPEPAAPVEEAPAEEQPTTDENAGDQQGKGKKDKKPKKPKQPQDGQQPPDSGGSGQEGSTGATGQDGGTLPPEGE
ncbi:MAG: hypothetical protein ACRDLQ_02650 [Solirubrobacterales bacterium]